MSDPPIDDWARDIATQELFRLATDLPTLPADEAWERMRRLTPQQRAFIVSGFEGAAELLD